jgi:hypothetical protein
MLDFKPGKLKSKLRDSNKEGWNNDLPCVGGDKPRPQGLALISDKSLNLGQK